jgi:hypothetical protein
VAIPDEHPTAVEITRTDTVRTLADWANELRAAAELATTLCKTSFVPADFRGKPEETAAAILTGAQMGIGPMTALRSMHVIKGRVGMYAKAKVALLVAHGHRVWTEQRTDDSVTVAGLRRGLSIFDEKSVERITITMEQAKTAGWTSNETYRKTPQDMLWARAASRVCDLVAPDLIHGIATMEEADDLPPIQAIATVGAPVTVDQIDATDQAAAAETPAVDKRAAALAPLMTQQRNEILARFRRVGINDRAARLAVSSQIIQRPADQPLKTANDLTAAEAQTIIDTLKRAETNPEPLRYVEQLLDLNAGDLTPEPGGDA